MQSVAKKTLTTLSVLPFHGENATLYVKTAKPHKREGGGEFEVTITSAPHIHTSRKDREIDKASSKRDGDMDMDT